MIWGLWLTSTVHLWYYPTGLLSAGCDWRGGSGHIWRIFEAAGSPFHPSTEVTDFGADCHWLCRFALGRQQWVRVGNQGDWPAPGQCWHLMEGMMPPGFTPLPVPGGKGVQMIQKGMFLSCLGAPSPLLSQQEPPWAALFYTSRTGTIAFRNGWSHGKREKMAESGLSVSDTKDRFLQRGSSSRKE